MYRDERTDNVVMRIFKHWTQSKHRARFIPKQRLELQGSSCCPKLRSWIPIPKQTLVVVHWGSKQQRWLCSLDHPHLLRNRSSMAMGEVL